MSVKSNLQDPIKSIKELQEEFRCMRCDDDFVLFISQESLNTHIKDVHQKRRPFKCGECVDKTFLDKAQLLNHIRSVHEEKMCRFDGDKKRLPVDHV